MIDFIPAVFNYSTILGLFVTTAILSTILFFSFFIYIIINEESILRIDRASILILVFLLSFSSSTYFYLSSKKPTAKQINELIFKKEKILNIAFNKPYSSSTYRKPSTLYSNFEEMETFNHSVAFFNVLSATSSLSMIDYILLKYHSDEIEKGQSLKEDEMAFKTAEEILLNEYMAK